MICEICVENVHSEKCLCNTTKTQCLSCIIENDNKCCFCNEKYNVYHALFEGYVDNEKFFLNFEKFLNKKIVKSENVFLAWFPRAKTLAILLNDWLDDEKNLTNQERYTIEQRLWWILEECMFPGNYTNLAISSAMYLMSFIHSSEKLPIYKYINNETLQSFMFQNDCSVYEYTYVDDKWIGNIEIMSDDELEDEIEDCEINPRNKFFSMLTKQCSIVIDKINTNKCHCNLLTCDECNNKKYCKGCLNDYHGDCGVKLEIICKMCPMCKTLVMKENGCDDMWCISCKIFFSWRQGIIRNDFPHNPDFERFNLQQGNVWSPYLNAVFESTGIMGSYNEDADAIIAMCNYLSLHKKDIRDAVKVSISQTLSIALAHYIIINETESSVRTSVDITKLRACIKAVKDIDGFLELDHSDTYEFNNMYIDMDNERVYYL